MHIEALLKSQLKDANASPRNIFVVLMALIASSTDIKTSTQHDSIYTYAANLVVKERNSIGASILKSSAFSLIDCLWSDLQKNPTRKTTVEALGYLFSIILPSKFYLFFEQFSTSLENDILLARVMNEAILNMPPGECTDKLLLVCSKKTQNIQLVKTLASGFSTLSILPLDCNELLLGAIINKCKFTDIASTNFFVNSIIPEANLYLTHPRYLQLLSLLTTIKTASNELIAWIIKNLSIDVNSQLSMLILRSLSIENGTCDILPLLALMTSKLPESNGLKSDLLKSIGLLVEKFLDPTQKSYFCNRLLQNITPNSMDLLTIFAPSCPEIFEFIIAVTPSKASLKALEGLLPVVQSTSYSKIIQIISSSPPSKTSYRILNKMISMNYGINQDDFKIFGMLILGLKEKSSSIRSISSEIFKKISKNVPSPEIFVGKIVAGIAGINPLTRSGSLKALSLIFPIIFSEENIKMETTQILFESVLSLLETFNPGLTAEANDASLALISMFKRNKTESKRIVNKFFEIAPLSLIRSFVGFLLEKKCEHLVPDKHKRLMIAVRKSKNRSLKKLRSTKEIYSGQDTDTEDTGLITFDTKGHLILKESDTSQARREQMNICNTHLIEDKDLSLNSEFIDGDGNMDSKAVRVASTKQKSNTLINKNLHIKKVSSAKSLQSYSYVPLSRKFLLANKSRKKRSALLCFN